MSSKTQLIGGAFQDSEGNVLANGTLQLVLNQDNSVTGSGNIAAGIAIIIQLDSNGNAASSSSTPPASNQYIWGTDVMAVPNAYYRVTGFTAAGQPAWGPNNQQVTSGSTFDLGTWVPNQIVSWVPPVQSLSLKVNGSAASSQTIQNLESGSGVTVTDNGSGNISFSASGGLDPSSNRWVLWNPATAAIGDWNAVNDERTGVDSGATLAFNPPTGTTNYALAMTGNRTVGGIPVFWSGRNFTFKAAMTSATGSYTGATFAGGYIGLIDSVNSGWFSGVAAENHVAFVVDGSVWACEVGNGSSSTLVATSASVSSRHLFEIDYTPTSVVFKIDGTTVATISTNIPSSTALGVFIFSKSGSGTQVFTTEYMYCTAPSV